MAVFCPTSNLFLGSGLFDDAGLAAAGVRRAVATDIGAGTSYSMLRTLDEAYKILSLNGTRLDPLHAFWRMTLGNAAALGLETEIGSLAPGTEADIVVLDSAAAPAMALRMETVERLREELFVLRPSATTARWSRPMSPACRAVRWRRVASPPRRRAVERGFPARDDRLIGLTGTTNGGLGRHVGDH